MPAVRARAARTRVNERAMRRRTFLGTGAAAALYALAPARAARAARALTVSAYLRAPRERGAWRSRYGAYDPLYLASGNWGGNLLCAALYEGLYRRDGRGQIKHAMVAETRADPGRRHWELRLATTPGAEQISATDVAQRLRWVFSHSRRLKEDPDIATPIRAVIGVYGGWITDIDASGPHTVTIRGRQALPYLTAVLAEPALRIPLSPPDERAARAGDGPMALRERPQTYGIGADRYSVSGTFFELVPRNGAVMRQAAGPIDLMALQGAEGRSVLLARGRVDVALQLNGKRAAAQSTVLVHTTRQAVGVSLGGKLAQIQGTRAGAALRATLGTREVLRENAPYGTRHGANAPSNGFGCASRTPAPGRDARSALPMIEGKVRCGGTKEYRAVAERAAHTLRAHGVDAEVGSGQTASEIGFHRIDDTADPRLAVLRVLPYPGSTQARGRPEYPAEVRENLVAMMASATPAQAREHACKVLEWSAKHHPWLMLGWLRTGTGVGPAVTGHESARRTRALDLDNLVEQWSVR